MLDGNDGRNMRTKERDSSDERIPLTLFLRRYYPLSKCRRSPRTVNDGGDLEAVASVGPDLVYDCSKLLEESR